MDLFTLAMQVTDPAGPFQEGSGVSITRLRGLILITILVATAIWAAWVVYGLLQQKQEGQLTGYAFARDVTSTLIMLMVVIGIVYAGR